MYGIWNNENILLKLIPLIFQIDGMLKIPTSVPLSEIYLQLLLYGICRYNKNN